MKIIFIRHAEPDYRNDTLTEKGWREAKILSERVSKWKVDDFYVSPLGRAMDTARPSLEKMHRSAEPLDWLCEFHAPVIDPSRGGETYPWDFLPGYWTKFPQMYDKTEFADEKVMNTDSVGKRFTWICSELDSLLEKYGYKRDGGFYRVDHTSEKTDDTIVFFCHLGVTMYLLGYLLGVSPVVLSSGFFLAPASVTVMATEEREAGIAYFRCQCMGDTSHLRLSNEPVSQMGYFTEPFQD